MTRPPPIDGIAPSHLQLPPDGPSSLIDALSARFPAVPAATWLRRFERGRVLGRDRQPLAPDSAAPVGLDVYYYREVDDEPVLAAMETIMHVDEHLIVVDKPHFLPVVPAGRFVRETLLARLLRTFPGEELAPLHRIDRLTAGLVLFSRNRATRDAYQALFRERHIEKRYEAIAPALPRLAFPRVHRSRIEAGAPFFRMREGEGAPNSETRIDVIDRTDPDWRYALEPVTGRKHQLRVHMAALGAPIQGDPLYPTLADPAPDDFDRPLKLLASSLAFVDPIGGFAREFRSRLML